MIVSLGAQRDVAKEWEATSEEVILGIDVLELLGSSLYLDPLTAYREYVQNAADAIDEARSNGVLPVDTPGRVEVSVDPASRTARIRDNGTGLDGEAFARRLTALGASVKRGKNRRGFRGVGRLAGIAYCQNLVFRSRSRKDEPILELRWKCRELKELLRSNAFQGTLADAVRATTEHRAVQLPDYPDRFFEVELQGVVRHGKDDLLNPSAIQRYLSQVAPVPFSPEFALGAEIEEFLSDLPTTSDLSVFVNGIGPIHRPHRDTIALRRGVTSHVEEVQFVTIPDTSGGIAAKGWVLHHSYSGAIPSEANVSGLRLRSGNIQVGDSGILDASFKEPRFNVWSVGEFHILDRRVTPNSRRDQFEHGAHFANILNQLLPIAREISNRCRTRSNYRQQLRRAAQLAEELDSGLAILNQSALAAPLHRSLVADLNQKLAKLERVSTSGSLEGAHRESLRHTTSSLRRRLNRALKRKLRTSLPLARLSPRERRIYQEVIAHIYACLGNARRAKELVDRLLVRIGSRAPL